MKSPAELPALLQRSLDLLRPVPPRDPARAAQGKAAFLQHAVKLASNAELIKNSSQQAVSQPLIRRHNQWIDPITQFIQRALSPNKERSPMMSTIATVLLITSLLLGGSGAVVVAAQGSLPDQPLYSVKTWSEQTRADWAQEPEAQLRLALELAERRAGEVDAMLDQGKTPPQAVQEQLRTQLDLALQIAAGQPEADAVRELTQVRERLHNMEHLLGEAGPDPDGGQLREQVRVLVQERLRLCESGLEDPLKLQEHLRFGIPEEKGPAGEQPKGPQEPGPKGTATGAPLTPGGHPDDKGYPQPDGGHEESYGPGPHNGQQPRVEGSPTPGASYGPGDSNNPGAGTTPTPGSSYGPGDGNGGGSPNPQDSPECGECTGPGPQPEQPHDDNGGGQPELGHGGGGGGDNGGSGGGGGHP